MTNETNKPAAADDTPPAEHAKRLADECHAALNVLTKWRRVFAAWQLGVVALTHKGHPTIDAVVNASELAMLMRAELSAMTNLLISRGVFTPDDWHEQLKVEADELSKGYAPKFPGFKAGPDGITLDNAIAADTMRGWLQ